MKRLLLALAALALVAGCGSSKAGKPTPSELNGADSAGPYLGAGLDPAQPRPSFTLTDATGKPFAFGTKTAGHPTFLYFGYTNCPDVCPTVMADIATATRHVPASLARRTYVVFVTTDVRNDTGPVMREWLAHFPFARGVQLVGLRGSQTQIDGAQAAAHIALASDDGKTHSASALLYGRDDYAHVLFLQSNKEADAMIHDLKIVGGQA